MPGETNVTVERAVEGDNARMVALSNWAAEHTAANFSTEPETLEDWTRNWAATEAMYPWLVAKQAGEVVGFAKGGPYRVRGAYRWTAEVSVYVDASVHRRGVGGALYRRLIPTLRAQGYATLLAGITTPNPASVRLHESVGFARCGTYHRVGWKFGEWHDVGYWELHLRTGGEAPEGVKDVGAVTP